MSSVPDFLFRYRNWIFGVMLTLAVGLLIYAHAAGSTTPQVASWTTPPAIHVCQTAPEWADPGTEAMTKAVQFWKDAGWSLGDVRFGPCDQLCSTRALDGKERMVACTTGAVTVDLRDQWFDEAHAGECLRPVSGPLTWSAILLPSVLYGDESSDEMLPADAEALVLAHELGHCAIGFSHNLGPPLFPGLRLNPKTGSIMNPSLYASGWNTEGVTR